MFYDGTMSQQQESPVDAVAAIADTVIDKHVRKQVIIWCVRWTLGFALIWWVTAKWPSIAWLWYVGIATALVSLISIFLIARQQKKHFAASGTAEDDKGS